MEALVIRNTRSFDLIPYKELERVLVSPVNVTKVRLFDFNIEYELQTVKIQCKDQETFLKSQNVFI